MNAASPSKPLRLWPGVALVTLQWLLRFVVPFVKPDAMIFGVPAMYVGVLGGMACGLLIVAWWLFFSRAAWAERLGAVVLMVVALAATPRITDPSIRTGMMGMLFYVYAIPVLCLAFVGWAAASRRLSDGLRRVSMAATILIACGLWALVRTGGISGDSQSDFQWRWAKTPEERLMAESGEEPAPLPPAPPAVEALKRTPLPQASAPAVPSPAAAAEALTEAAPSPQEPAFAPAEVATDAEWPGFRGPGRDGIVRGVRIETNWTVSPPVELWRKPIGPGWSSFAVEGDLVYTQEQRGDDEIVACYRLSSGEPVWRHRDPARFWESNAGAGPRSTPTLGHGRVYTLGATGILNALDAGNGAVVWSRNAASDTRTKVPGWGFAGSPLLVGDVVVVATAGKLVAYDLATGTQRWRGPDHTSGYSSPHLMTIGGVEQVLLMNGAGATSVAAADGAVLWEHALPDGARIVQPALTGNGEVLMSDGDFGDGNHMRSVTVTRGPSGWNSEERWASMALKPNFNDFVVHKGYAYGFDGSILACIDLADGKRRWKGGRYGSGQLVLLADQDVLLVLSEEGELALVGATPDQFTELARFKAIDGKTWNHPVVVGDVVLVRNGEEMAAFRLPPAL